jgi:hypothetical protein
MEFFYYQVTTIQNNRGKMGSMIAARSFLREEFLIPTSLPWQELSDFTRKIYHMICISSPDPCGGGVSGAYKLRKPAPRLAYRE